MNKGLLKVFGLKVLGFLDAEANLHALAAVNVEGYVRCDDNEGLEGFRVSDQGLSSLGTQKAHKHKHVIGISLPYWASL